MKISRIISIACFFVVTSVWAGPKIDSWQTAEGARVFFVENHDLPILDVQADFVAGTLYDQSGKIGQASLTHALLDLGVQGLDENAIANRLADLGAVLSGGVDMDRASVSLRTLSEPDKMNGAVDLMRLILNAPTFPEEVFLREKTRTIAGLKESLTRPDSIASKAFWDALYPSHPYGRSASPETVNALTREDLIAFYKKHYTANNAIITIVGDIARTDAAALAEKLTSALPKASRLATQPDLAFPSATEKRIAHPASQAHILMGMPAIKRGDPDFFPLVVGNYVLGGGGFVSRLMSEVREKRGFAYSVYSTFMSLKQEGPFQIGLQTKKSQAADALKVTQDVLKEFLANGPTEAELLAAKKNLMGSFPLRLDSNGKLLANVAMIGFYGLPLDYLDQYTANIEKVSVDDVKNAFSRHVKLEHLITVVVAGE